MDDYFNIYITQFTAGCDCPYCKCDECFSCKNFKYIDYETNDLEELADNYKNSKDRLCPNFSPFVINMQIFDDIDEFSDWVNIFIEGSESSLDYFYDILSKPDIYSLSFMGENECTYSDFSIDEDKLIKFINKLNEKMDKSQYSDKIFDLLSHYFNNPNPLSLHNLRGIVFGYSLMPFMKIDDLTKFLVILRNFMCDNASYHLLFYNQLNKYHSYSELVVKIIKSSILQFIALKDPNQTLNSIHTLSTILLDLYLFDANSPPYFPHDIWEIDEISNILSIQVAVPILDEPINALIFFAAPFEYKAMLKDRYSEFIKKKSRNPLRIHVPRDNIIKSLDNLKYLSPEEFQKPLEIDYIGETGQDRGGISREFFYLTAEKLFSPDFGMFDIKQNFYWFRYVTYNGSYFKTLGILVGLAFSNSVVLPIRFPLLLYKKILGLPLTIDDLEEIDSDLASSFHSLRELIDNGEDISNAEIRFEATIDNFGTAKEVPLIPNGSDIIVNNDNFEKYVETYLNWYFYDSVKDQFEMFNRGFNDALGPSKSLLSIFFPEDLDILISGKEEYNWDEFKQNAVYTGYDENSETIKIFWKIFFDKFTQEQKINFLMFVTGSKRVPIQGMKEVKLRIQRTTSTQLLPVSHTCAVILQLPDYKDEEIMTKYLEICADNCEGFGVI